MAPRLRIRISYLGTHFAGWQKQINARTVQGELEKALAHLYRQPVPTVGAGRTDAGVHADAQEAHFDPPLAIPPAGVLQALNGLLPWDIRILRVTPVFSSFHARHSAVGKRYRYRLAWGKVLPPWEGLRRLWLPHAPNPEVLAAALRLFLGEHDFVSFSLSGHSGHGKRGTVRTIFIASVTFTKGKADIVLEGDGFLRGMARRLVGATLEVARGRQDLSWLKALLTGERALPPAPTAPSYGLSLEQVFYRRPQRWEKSP